MPLPVKHHQRFQTILFLIKLFLNENDSSPKLKFKKIRSLPPSLDINIYFDDKKLSAKQNIYPDSLSENVCIIRATNLIFFIYIQIKLSEIHREHCHTDAGFVDLVVF